MERDAKTMVRGEQLLRLWDDMETPHPKAGYRYLAKHKGYGYSTIGPNEVTVDVLSLDDGFACYRIDAYSSGYVYHEWMLIRDWDWEVVK